MSVYRLTGAHPLFRVSLTICSHGPIEPISAADDFAFGPMVMGELPSDSLVWAYNGIDRNRFLRV